MAPPTRREFLRHAGTAMAGLTVPWIAGCGDGRAPGDSGLPAGEAGPPIATFQHGVASGDPLHDRVILWTRVTPAVPGGASVTWTLGTDPEISQVLASGTVGTGPGRDYTVKVDASGLAPDTIYYYRFAVGGAVSPTGRTRTAPLGGVSALKFAVVTCGDFSRGFFQAYARVAERDDLNAVIHLGDYIYENGNTDRVRPHEPPHEVRTLDGYRSRYSSYRREPQLAALHARHPMIWVWDDHETVNDAWREGSDDHDDAEDGPFPARAAAALQAALEWMPIRSPDSSNPLRIYRSFAFGDLVDLIMIDTRRIGRDRPPQTNALFQDIGVVTESGEAADPARQMLGLEQEAWLAGQFAASTAHWRLLGNQVIFSPLKVLGTPRATGTSLYLSADKWDGYFAARDRVLDMMRATNNVVVLTGDAHESYAFEVTPDPNNPLAYNPLTGAGALAVEFLTPAITSRGDPADTDSLTGVLDAGADAFERLLQVTNPHLKYFENTLNGYVMLDITMDRVNAEFWHVPMVTEPTEEQALGAAFTVASGSNHLERLDGLPEPL